MEFSSRVPPIFHYTGIFPLYLLTRCQWPKSGKGDIFPLFSSENHRVIISLFGSLLRSKKPLKGAFTKRAFCAKFNGRMLLEKKTRSTLGSGDAFDQKVNNSRGLQKWLAAVTLYFPVTPFFLHNPWIKVDGWDFSTNEVLSKSHIHHSKKVKVMLRFALKKKWNFKRALVWQMEHGCKNDILA